MMWKPAGHAQRDLTSSHPLPLVEEEVRAEPASANTTLQSPLMMAASPGSTVDLNCNHTALVTSPPPATSLGSPVVSGSLRNLPYERRLSTGSVPFRVVSSIFHSIQSSPVLRRKGTNSRPAFAPGCSSLEILVSSDPGRFVLEFLDVYDLSQLIQCSQNLRQTTDRESLWHQRTCAQFPRWVGQKRPVASTWKAIYISEHRGFVKPVLAMLKNTVTLAVGQFLRLNFLPVTAADGAEPDSTLEAIDDFSNPPENVRVVLERNGHYKSLFKAKQQIVHSQAACMQQARFMPLLLISFVSLLICEVVAPDFFVYPYFVVSDASRGELVQGQFIDMSVGYRFWPFFLYTAIITLCTARFDRLEQSHLQSEVLWWKMFENTLVNTFHECQFRYVNICMAMFGIIALDWTVEMFCYTMSFFGVLLSVRSTIRELRDLCSACIPAHEPSEDVLVAPNGPAAAAAAAAAGVIDAPDGVGHAAPAAQPAPLPTSAPSTFSLLGSPFLASSSLWPVRKTLTLFGSVVALLVNAAWLQYHWRYDFCEWLSHQVVTPLFHLITFGIHRNVVYGHSDTTTMFCSAIMILLLVEILVNIRWARLRSAEPLSRGRIAFVTARSLINSHVYIYIMMHVGAWHVLYVKLTEEILTHSIEYAMVRLGLAGGVHEDARRNGGSKSVWVDHRTFIVFALALIGTLFGVILNGHHVLASVGR